LVSGVQGATLVLPEDEVILPPLLNRVQTDLGAALDGVNVRSANEKSRRAVPGEWFDFGDTLALPATLAFEVIQSEDFAWVGGGGFQGTIGNYLRTETTLIQHSLELKRGWIRVWIRPGKQDSVMRIEGNGDVFAAKDAEFWLNIRTGATELYVIRGEVTSQATHQTYSSGVYVSLLPGKKSPKGVSQAWDPKAMEVPIASAYPSLMKVSGMAGSDWEAGRTARLYGDYRKKGWRKFYRFTPLRRK